MKTITLLHDKIDDVEILYTTNIYVLDKMIKTLEFFACDGKQNFFANGCCDVSVMSGDKYGIICKIDKSKFNDISKNYNDLYTDNFVDSIFADTKKYVVRKNSMLGHNIFIKPKYFRFTNYNDIKQNLVNDKYSSTLNMNVSNVSMLENILKKYKYVYICDNIYPNMWVDIITFDEEPEIILDTWINLKHFIGLLKRGMNTESKFYCNRYLVNKFLLDVVNVDIPKKNIRVNDNNVVVNNINHKKLDVININNFLSLSPLVVNVTINNISGNLQIKSYLPNNINLWEYISDSIPKEIMYENNLIKITSTKHNAKFMITIV